MKKASIQLSINFIVVLIICLVLLGIGIKLIGGFITGATKMKEDVDEYHKRQLIRALDEGDLVATYPNVVTIQKGQHADFSLVISNELGREQDFSIYVKDVSSIPGEPPEILYERAPFNIKNNEHYFTPVRIIIEKASGSGAHLFNIYVCKTEPCLDTTPKQDKYGSLQKIQVNVR